MTLGNAIAPKLSIQCKLENAITQKLSTQQKQGNIFFRIESIILYPMNTKEYIIALRFSILLAMKARECITLKLSTFYTSTAQECTALNSKNRELDCSRTLHPTKTENTSPQMV
jgi:hypothetical protein